MPPTRVQQNHEEESVGRNKKFVINNPCFEEQDKMSLQELAIEVQQESGDKISWFKRTCPWFFTEKVVANRESGFVLVSPKPPPKQHWQPLNWQPIGRKPGTGRSPHVLLHLNGDTKSFYFKCTCEGVPLPVTRDVLMAAISLGQKHEWVRIGVGTEVFHLNRTELRTAILTLEG